MNSSAASAWSPTRGTPQSSASRREGSSQTSASRATTAAFPQPARSTRMSRVCAGQGNCGSFARMASAEITVRIPPSRREASIAVAPAVKLRFTGIFPASSTARLAM